MIPLSVYYVTQDEERRLPRSLARAAEVADEIVVVDSGSTDRTEEIARGFGARFIHNDWVSIGHQVSFAERCCTNPWVLRLDADEVLSEGLVKEILEVKRGPRFDGYRLRIGDVFPGIEKPSRWVKHYKLIRLYNREKMRMSGRFDHDDVVFGDSTPHVGLLVNFVHHYSLLSLEHLIGKGNASTGMQVKRALVDGKRYSPWRMVGASTLGFLKLFLLGRFFFYGFWGFIASVVYGQMRFLKFAKYYEYRQLQALDEGAQEKKETSPPPPSAHA